MFLYINYSSIQLFFKEATPLHLACFVCSRRRKICLEQVMALKGKCRAINGE